MKKQDADKFLDALKNGKWYTTTEITDRTKIEGHKLKLLTSFLQKFDFIQTDKKTNRMRLSPPTKKFLDRLGKANPTSSYEEITA